MSRAPHERQDTSERTRMEAALARAEQQQAELQRRLLALAAGSAALLESPRLDDVLAAILGLARDLIAADGYAVWRFEPRREVWQVVASSGVSRAFTSTIVESFGGQAPANLPFTEPLVVEDVMASQLLAGRRDEYRLEGIKSMLALPLMVAGRLSGTLVCYYRSPMRFSPLELQVGRALAGLTSAAITTAELYDEQRRTREAAERNNEQATFLSDAGAALSSSLDYARTLSTVASLAVPHIADWCAVDIVGENGQIRRVAVAHVDPDRIEAVRLLQERYPERPGRAGTVSRVIETAQPVMVPVIPDALLVDAAIDDEHLQAIRSLHLVSFACMPMIAHGRTLGALTFATADSGRILSQADFRFLQEVAYRAALAVDNAQAYDQVAAANKSKDQFLAMVSHELRTPVNAVLGWIRLLRLGAVPPGREGHALDVIERNAQAQLRLIEDLLDMSRIIAGKFRLDMQRVDPAAVVRGAIESMQPAAAERRVDLDVALIGEVGVVRADAARLEQVLSNLIGNAIKFSNTGDRVLVRLTRDGALAVISVSDSGPGISHEEQEKIFDRFQQGQAATERARGGLGLGLAIVRHIVEMHGGRVSVASGGAGHGATFRVELPFVAPFPLADDETALRSEATLAGPPRSDIHLDGVTVLAVDDNAEALELLGSVLTHHGAQVWGALSGTEALRMLDEDIPSVIISDIAMPDQDGFAFVTAVRQRPRSRGGAVPAIALTAFSRPEDRARSLRSGFQIHLSKPVDVQELLIAVASLARVPAAP